MIRILLNGANGQMGRAISEAASANREIEIAHRVDIAEGFENIEEISKGDVDVAIDLSSPEGFRRALAWAVKNEIPIVVGTTGLRQNDFLAIDEAAKTIPVLQASNLSKGVNILFEIVERAASLAHESEIEIVEMHHDKKRDAPSGTALEIGKIISKAQPERNLFEKYGRSGLEGKRKADEIGYHSIRCGDVVGEHLVIFGFEGERIEIAHKAGSRKILADGALSAASFLVGKRAGRYSMRDLILSQMGDKQSKKQP